MVCPSLGDALQTLGCSMDSFDEVFVAGGEQIYHEAIVDYMYLCKKIYVTKFKTDHSCDQFFPFDNVKDIGLFCDPLKTRDYVGIPIYQR